MKTSSGILALVVCSIVSALPHGDRKRALPTEDETQYLKQAIELLSSYEYGGDPYPPIKPPKGTGGIKAPVKFPDTPVPYPPKLEPELAYVQNNKRSPLKKEEEAQIRQAIELLSSYEYGQSGPGPFYPQGPDLQYAPKIKRAPLKQEEEYELKQAIELLSYYEYGQQPSDPIKPVKPKYLNKPVPHLPTLDQKLQYVPKAKRSPLKVEEQYEIQQAIEILSQYEYGQPQPPVPPVKPIPVRPTPNNPKYVIPRLLDDVDATESIRAAIELLTKYEYGPQLDQLEHIARSIPDAEKESLIAAIELLNKYEYKYPPSPWIKPYPIYTLDPVSTLKPAPVPTYEPAPIKEPVIGKRKIKEIVDQYSEGWTEADYYLAIEELTQKEYINKPVPEPYIPHPSTKSIPAPTYKPVPLPTVKPKPLPLYNSAPFIPEPKILPQYPKRSEHPNLNREEYLRLAIETLSKIEYGQPGPVKPLPGKPVPQPSPLTTFDVEKETNDSKVE